MPSNGRASESPAARAERVLRQGTLADWTALRADCPDAALLELFRGMTHLDRATVYFLAGLFQVPVESFPGYRPPPSLPLVNMEVLRWLMAQPALASHRLVGGAALAFQLGHRESIDLDLFTPSPPDRVAIASRIVSRGQMLIATPSFVSLHIEGIKVDIYETPYIPPANAHIEVDGIRTFDLETLGIMKLWSLAARRHRSDYMDLAVLLARFPLAYLMQRLVQYRPETDGFVLCKRLLDTVEAETQPLPQMHNGMGWDAAMDIVAAGVRTYLLGAQI